MTDRPAPTAPPDTPAGRRLVDLSDRHVFRVAAGRLGKRAKAATGASAKHQRQLARQLRTPAKEEPSHG